MHNPGKTFVLVMLTEVRRMRRVSIKVGKNVMELCHAPQSRRLSRESASMFQV